MIDKTRLVHWEGKLAEHAWAYFDALGDGDIERRFREAVARRSKGDSTVEEFRTQFRRLGFRVAGLMGVWLDADLRWNREHWMDFLSAATFSFSDDGRRLVATGLGVFGFGNSVPPEVYRPGYIGFQNQGPLMATVKLDRNPGRVVAYTIRFLTDKVPLGRSCPSDVTFAPPTPPDAWRFVVTRGDCVGLE